MIYHRIKYDLNLADGSSISIYAEDEASEEVVSFFARASQLKENKNSSGKEVRIIVKTSGNKDAGRLDVGNVQKNSNCEKTLILDPDKIPRIPLRDEDNKKIIKKVPDLLSKEEWMGRQLIRLSALVGSCVFNNGGFLIHSGIVEFKRNFVKKDSNKSKGILIAGASGSGKTTASKMFRPPWYSLSDDLTLLVKDKAGEYYAHPFPTWSRFLGKESSVLKDSWNIERYVPIKVVLFIDRGPESRLEPIGKGEALSLLTELVKQSNEHFLALKGHSFIIRFNKKYFFNIYHMVKTVKCYTYNLKINGTFWKEIEESPEILNLIV